MIFSIDEIPRVIGSYAFPLYKYTSYSSYERVVWLTIIGSILLVMLGSFTLIKSKLRMGVILASFGFFGKCDISRLQLSFFIGTMTWNIGFCIEGRVGTNLISYISMGISLTGAIVAGGFINEPYSLIMLGMGVGSSFVSFISWYFKTNTISTVLGFVIPLLSGLLSFKFPHYQTYYIQWLGSYFFISGIMMISFIISVYKHYFKFGDYRGAILLSSISITLILILFIIKCIIIIHKKPK